MNVKRQTTIAIHTGVSADPGDDDFFVDGDLADLIVDMKVQAGTSVVADAKELIDGGLDLVYDGQTANFNVGATLTGYDFSGKGSHAQGKIVNDVDGGVTGTLTLKEVTGKFEDNMVIVDDGGTPGAALVNDSAGGTKVRLVGGTWATLTANAVGVFQTPFVNPDLTAGDGDFRRVTPREFRIEYTFNAITDADFAVDIGQVL